MRDNAHAFSAITVYVFVSMCVCVRALVRAKVINFSASHNILSFVQK